MGKYTNSAYRYCNTGIYGQIYKQCIPVLMGKYTNSAYRYRWANIQTVHTGIVIPVLVGKYFGFCRPDLKKIYFMFFFF